MGVSDTIRSWLILFRAHTAILEAPLAVLGAGLALGTIYDPRILLWLLFGVLYHLVGYSMNSYVDWKKGFDKDDPHKEHHPLNTGDITPRSAKIGVYASLALLIIVGFIAGGFNLTSAAMIATMLVLGVSYNFFGKYTRLKFIPIALVHTMVFVFPYYTYTDQVSTMAILIASAYTVHHIYQIAISGDIKDIKQDESSLIKDLGAYVEDNFIDEDIFHAGSKVQYLAFNLTVAQLGLAVGLIAIYSNEIYYIVISVLLGAWMVYETDSSIKSGKYIRSRRLSSISRREIAGYSMIHLTISPVIGFQAYVLVIVCMLVYLFTTSKFMWGNFVRPEV